MGRDISAMTFKIIYARGIELNKVLIEAASLKEALRKGYQQHHWDSVLEISTPDDKPLQATA